jgi:DNA repair photolyase
VYCNALGQEEGNNFIPVQIDTNYFEFLREEIKKHRGQELYPLYYYSPKTDCFQKALLETGITKQILEVFNEFGSEYIIVSKGVPTEDVFEEILKSKERCQVIITYGMPNEEYRIKLEKDAATNDERFQFAKKCVETNVQTCIILEPILPLADLSFVADIIKRFTEINIKHFALDFARISDVSLQNIVEILPECKEQFESVYLNHEADKQNFCTAKGTIVTRSAPSKKYILERFMEFKDIAKQYGATVSSCNSFGFDEFNEDANKAGYQCMGIKLSNT